jgi:hypothetical protein
MDMENPSPDFLAGRELGLTEATVQADGFHFEKLGDEPDYLLGFTVDGLTVISLRLDNSRVEALVAMLTVSRITDDPNARDRLTAGIQKLLDHRATTGPDTLDGFLGSFWLNDHQRPDAADQPRNTE